MASGKNRRGHRSRYKKKRSGRGRVIGILLVILLVLLLAFGGVMLLRNTPERRFARQMAAGESYLEEGNYAQAAVAYEAAIGIRNDDPDAYGWLIYAYGSDLNAQGVTDTCARAEEALSPAELQTLKQTASAHLTEIGDRFFAAGEYDNVREIITGLRVIDEAAAYRLGERVIEATAPPVGSVLPFGTYLGAPLEWTVLDRQGGNVLLLCNQTVDSMSFTQTQIGVAWEYSTLRKWLASEFWNAAFTLVEQNRIAETAVPNPANPEDQRTVNRKDTYDRVFVLSMQEVAQYFPVEADRALQTAYWTRTSAGRSESGAVCVSGTGAFETQDVRDAVLGVRPALWMLLQ